MITRREKARTLVLEEGEPMAIEPGPPPFVTVPGHPSSPTGNLVPFGWHEAACGNPTVKALC